MKRVSGIVLLAGVVTLAFGVLLLVVSDQVEGVVWYGACIATGGVILIAMWLKSKLDPPPTEDEIVADVDA